MNVEARPLADSINDAHREAARAERAMHELLGAISLSSVQQETDVALSDPTPLCDHAGDLAYRLSDLASMCERAVALVGSPAQQRFVKAGLGQAIGVVPSGLGDQFNLQNQLNSYQA